MLGVVTLLSALQLARGAGSRLPGGAVPAHYGVTLLYDLDPSSNFSFFGNVDILLTARNSISEIVLHAEDLDIAGERVTMGGDEASVAVSGVQRDAARDFLTVRLSQGLVAGRNYTLTIPFSGNLKIRLSGPYISHYIDKKTKKQEYLIATHFEAIGARMGFPCFDEPEYKASFQISIGHHRNYSALGNMPLANSSNDNALESIFPWAVVAEKFKKDQDDFVFDHFHTSVRMSTYLVAWVVSKFVATDSPPGLSDTKFKTWARPDAIAQTAYAATVGPKVLSHFGERFGVPYALPKLDQAAIPDFSTGATEFWGLVTYRENLLLYDEQHSTLQHKQLITQVVAHELAHQWFGNLVTMKWWSDLWLNEGFATFAASVGVAAVEPEWRAEDEFVVSTMIEVLSLDSLKSSHPVSVHIDDPDEIFDDISYGKGSLIIRMMSKFLGDDVFWKGINNYLVKYAYQNAEQDDLWQELTTASEQHGGGLPRDVTVKTVMDTWTTQTGYPLLTVTRDYDGIEVNITQAHFLADGSASPEGAAWWVPLRVHCGAPGAADNASSQWLAAHQGRAAVHRARHACAPEDWLLLNADMMAPLRVNYDARNWRLLAAALGGGRHAAVPVLGRAQLLGDALALAWAGLLDYDTALQIVVYLSSETEYLPLSAAMGELAKIEIVLKRTPDYGVFQRFLRRIVTKPYRRAQMRSFDAKNLNNVNLHALVQKWARAAEVPGSDESAPRLFRKWMKASDPDAHNPIPPETRAEVYCAALARGGAAHWRFLAERRRRTNVATADLTILEALACTREEWLLAQYLEWAVTNGSEIRRQDTSHVIASVAKSNVGYYIARSFVFTRYADIYKALDGDGKQLGGILVSVLEEFTTQHELDEFVRWREANAKYLGGTQFIVAQGEERARNNVAWTQRRRARAVAKLREYAGDDTDKDFRGKFLRSGASSRIAADVLATCALLRLAL